MINRNDAPEGYEAVAAFLCHGCAFWGQDSGLCETREPSCIGIKRADRQSVIFIKRRPRLVATGGRKPRPPEWARRFSLYLRDKHVVPSSVLDSEPAWDWLGRGDDILFVEWLP